MEKHYINIEIFRFINSHHNPIADAFFLGIWLFGTAYVLIPVLLFLYWRQRWKVPALLIAVAIETVVVHILKHVTAQPRPALVLSGVHRLQMLSKGSFPSGDAAIAFTVAFILALEERAAVRVALFVYGALIAYERIYLGVHFPLDVTAGAAIGLLSGHLASFRLKRRWPKKADG
jgi:undecaprenyl-diphosphatase